MSYSYVLKSKTDSSIEDKRYDLFKDINFKKYFLDNNIKLSATLSSYFDITKEHYHFLAYVSNFINNGKIIDTGTHRGGSALAFSYNQSNKIYTYDIEPFKGGITANVSNIPDNIIYDSSTNIIDLINTNPEQILDSDIFFVDINHEGPDEITIYNFLQKNKYKGIFILDDIHLNNEMREFWNYIQNTNNLSYDVTRLAHLIDNAGTGVVFFDDDNPYIKRIQNL